MFEILSEALGYTTAKISADNLCIRYRTEDGPNWEKLFDERWAEDFRKAEQAYENGER